MNAIRKMGPLSNIIGMLPGVPKEVRDVEIGDKELGRVEAIVRSMTTAERVDAVLRRLEFQQAFGQHEGGQVIGGEILLKPLAGHPQRVGHAAGRSDVAH